MSANQINQIASTLQTFISNNFISNCYNSDEEPDNCQIMQYKSVCAIIQQLHLQNPESLETLLDDWSIPIIPTIEAVNGVGHMQNIGTSASMCLKELQNNNQQQLADSTVRQLVEKFLVRVKRQSQDACTKHNAESCETVRQQQSAEFAEEKSREMFAPFLQEYNKLLVDKRKEFEAFTAGAKKELEQLSEGTKAELSKFFSDTKAKADEAARNAQTAKDTSNKVINKLRKATKAANLATKAADDARETSKNMLPNMLSALGIFVGIVVAVMACYLSIILTPNGENAFPTEYSRPFEFMRYLLMGHIILTVVFLLMYLISRISGYSLTCKCINCESANANGECAKCRNKCSHLVRFKLRYPYLYYINFACFLGYAFLALWQFINIYCRTDIDKWIYANPWPAFLIIVVVVFCIIMAVFLIFRFKSIRKTKLGKPKHRDHAGKA